MKRVYIAGPIRQGDITHNVQQAAEAAYALMAAGFAPLNPMTSCWSGATAGDGPAPGGHPINGFCPGPDAWLASDLAWVAVSDAVLRLPGASLGADGEVRHARRHGIPVYYDLDELVSEESNWPPVTATEGFIITESSP